MGPDYSGQMEESAQRFKVPDFEKIAAQKMPNLRHSVEKAKEFAFVEDVYSNNFSEASGE